MIDGWISIKEKLPFDDIPPQKFSGGIIGDFLVTIDDGDEKIVSVYCYQRDHGKKHGKWLYYATEEPVPKEIAEQVTHYAQLPNPAE